MTGQKIRVLEVEDSESDAALLVRLLRKSGYEVESERVEDAEGCELRWRDNLGM